jgi:hypothetical protein
VITAAGLFHLAEACAEVRNCEQPARWAPLARRMLTASLANIHTNVFPPGYLGGQVYNLRNKETWDDNAELMMGLDYALEAIKLARVNY